MAPDGSAVFEKSRIDWYLASRFCGAASLAAAFFLAAFFLVGAFFGTAFLAAVFLTAAFFLAGTQADFRALVARLALLRPFFARSTLSWSTAMRSVTLLVSTVSCSSASSTTSLPFSLRSIRLRSSSVYVSL